MNYQNQYNQQNQQNQQMFGGNTDGTPITLLRNDINSQNEQQANDNQSHYTVGSIETTSDIRNLVKEINSNIESKKQNKNSKKNNNTDTDTESLKSGKSEKSLKSTKSDKSKKIKKINKLKKSKTSNKLTKLTKQKKDCNTWEDYLYDFILLFIIFMLMSQEFVKNFIGLKIKLINVNDKGVVPITGVMVYGFIFVTVFIVMKILINKLIIFI
jgi:hypothetical protein